MKIITSSQNEWLKSVAKLNQKSYSKEKDLCLVETYKIVKECLGKNIVQYVIMTQSQYQKLGLLYPKTYVIQDNLATKLSQTTTTDGIFAVVSIPHKKMKDVDNILVLDHLQDPSNMGAIIRTAYACDYKTIYLWNCVYPYTTKVVRSSMGYVFDIDIVQCDKPMLENMKRKGYHFLCADMQGEDIFTINNFPKKHMLFIGNEGHGISHEIQKMMDSTVSIPMCNGVESLNASVSAGIIMYQIKTNVRRV